MGLILVLLLLAQSPVGPGADTTETSFWLSYSPSDSNPVLNDRGIPITINGVGAYTVGVSNGTCLQWSKTSGVAPETIMLRPGYFCSGTGGPGVGTHHFTATIAGAETRTINVTITITPSWPYPLMVSMNRLPNPTGICTDLWRGNWQSCPYLPTRPGEWIPPAVGESYTDPLFGTQIKRLVTGDIFRYANQHMVNYDETHLLTLNGLIRLSDGQYELVYNDAQRALDLRWFPEAGPARMYSMKEADTGISTYTLSGTTLIQENRYECGIGPLNSWFNGVSREGWVARSNYANTHLCAINVLTGEKIVGLGSAPVTNDRDNLYISRARDKVTGLHYLWYGGARGAVFAFKSGDTGFTPVMVSKGLSKTFGHQTYDGDGIWSIACPKSSWCIGQDHVDTAEIDGQQVLVTQNGWVVYFNRLTDDLEGMREAAGGVQIDTIPINHVGCADLVPFCAGYTRGVLSQPARSITGISSGDPARVTLNGALNVLSDGDLVQIARVGGCTSAIGNHTIANLNTAKTAFDLPGVTCNATFTSGGSATKAQWHPPGQNQRNRVHVYKLGAARTQIAVGDHRSLWFDGAGDDYFSGQPWAFMSPRGKYVLWKSNLGTPDERNIMIAEVNATAPGSDWLSADSRVTVTTGTEGLALEWADPGDSESCSLQVGPRRDFAGITPQVVSRDGGKFAYTWGGLQPNQPYHWRVVCGNFYVAAGSANTEPLGL